MKARLVCKRALVKTKEHSQLVANYKVMETCEAGLDYKTLSVQIHPVWQNLTYYARENDQTFSVSIHKAGEDVKTKNLQLSGCMKFWPY